MHIPDGILPAQVCIGGYALAAPVAWYSLRQIQRQPDPTRGIPKAALLTAVFFVASSISIPIPPASVHLVLNGLLGSVLGYYAFPAIMIGLFFQAIIIGHGGLTTLGVDAVMMGVPALLAYHVFRCRYLLANRLPIFWAQGCHRALVRFKLSRSTLSLGDQQWETASVMLAFFAGVVGLAVSALIFFALVITTIPSGFNAATEQSAIYGLTLAHIPLAILEGMFTAMLVLFLNRVLPDLLERRSPPKAAPGRVMDEDVDRVKAP